MLNYIEYLKVPTNITVVIISIILITQFIGELLEFKGKVVPEIFKMRKYFARQKQEHKTLKEIPEFLKEVKETLNDFNSHYSKDNISKRDNWIEKVNLKLDQNDKYIKELDKKIDKNNADTLSLLIDSKRNTIINFASFVIDENNPVTREQFNRVFKLYEEYEDIIAKNNMTNGEVDIAYRINKESYENHMRNHTFIENLRGYDN